MHFVAVLNREGGTLRTTDLTAFTHKLRETLENAGHSVHVEIVDGREIVAALARAASDPRVEIVIAGGGDGTVSAAAAKLMNTDKALAILPAGTMNLFARALAIPLTLDAAVAAFAEGAIRKVDVATANGRPFVHQFSVGMHAKLVQLRSKMEFGSRLGKIRASTKAAYDTIMRPPRIDAQLRIGDAQVTVRTTGIGITNNLFGEGHLPYPDRPDGGVLGIYITVAKQKSELFRLAWNLARGKWRDNDQVDIHQSDKVILTIRARHRKHLCVIDGELSHLDEVTEIRIHPASLNVLAPIHDDADILA